jgi:hypothetical protein
MTRFEGEAPGESLILRVQGRLWEVPRGLGYSVDSGRNSRNKGGVGVASLPGHAGSTDSFLWYTWC